MFVSGMLYLVYVLLGSKVNVISVGQAVGITFAVTAVVVLVVGVIIGFSCHLLCHALKKKIIFIIQQPQQQVQDKANSGQAYEEVSLSKPTMEKLEMGENVTYGPCS